MNGLKNKKKIAEPKDLANGTHHFNPLTKHIEDAKFIGSSFKKEADFDEFVALKRRVSLLEKKLNCKI